MESRKRFLLAVFVAYTAFVYLAVASPVLDAQESTPEDEKVLQECKHSDYRTYVACLTRHKRHHSQHDDDHLALPGSDCWDACMKKCEHVERLPDCHKQCNYCTRKTKHKHQIITEYETECVSGVCNNSTSQESQKPINITTIIDVHNYHNTSGSITGPDRPCIPPYCIVPFPPPPPPPPLLPQITISFAQSSIGCPYYSPWPCQPAYPPMPIPDCSGCGHPSTLFRCDVQCNSTLTPGRGIGNWSRSGSVTPCVTPYCVGGAQG